MLRTFVDWLTSTVGWLRRKQRIELPNNSEVVKVNLGCGLSVAPGWINVDGSLNALTANMPKWTHKIVYNLAGARQFYSPEVYCQILEDNRFIHHNLTFGIPLLPNVADFVYSSHFLEHLDRLTGRNMLQECLRVLKPGGTVRIGVPDLEYAWELYKQNKKARMLHDYFFIDGATGFSQHRYLYDYDMLAEVMTQLGFVNVVRSQYQQGAVPDLDVLDNRAEYTLFVEANKPVSKEYYGITK